MEDLELTCRKRSSCFKIGNGTGPTCLVCKTQTNTLKRCRLTSKPQDEPRSQFLHMGFHFAHLLAYCQSLKSPKSVIHSPIIKESIRLSQSIIQLAIDTTDERTRHLTDHIYHVITFAAITLCRIVYTYESKLRASNYDVAELDHLVFKLIGWLKSIGLPCHAAHILGDVVSAQFRKLRPGYQPIPSLATRVVPEQNYDFTTEDLAPPSDYTFLYPSFVGSELFDIGVGVDQWPEWSPIQSDADTSVQ